MTNTLPENFSAWLNVQPGGPHTFHVKGEVEVNSGGWSATLTSAVPQGSNPLIKLLDLVLTPPVGQAPQVISKVPATYEERPALLDYQQAQIRHKDEVFTIDVQVVR